LKGREGEGRRELLNRKADINYVNASGNSALHWAATNDQIEVVKLLLENDGDSTLRNTFGRKPFDEALARRLDRICELLAPHSKLDDEILGEPETMDCD